MGTQLKEIEQYNPAAEFEELLNRKFNSDTEAKIALIAFRDMSNATGHRGQFGAKVLNGKILKA